MDGSTTAKRCVAPSIFPSFSQRQLADVQKEDQTLRVIWDCWCAGGIQWRRFPVLVRRQRSGAGWKSGHTSSREMGYCIDKLSYKKRLYCSCLFRRDSGQQYSGLYMIRVCTNSRYRDHSNPLFAKLKTLKAGDINILQNAIFMFRLQNSQLPSYFPHCLT